MQCAHLCPPWGTFERPAATLQVQASMLHTCRISQHQRASDGMTSIDRSAWGCAGSGSRCRRHSRRWDFENNQWSPHSRSPLGVSNWTSSLVMPLGVRRFGKQVPTALKELVSECWAPVMGDRPDFGAITRRLEHIAKALPEVRHAPMGRATSPRKAHNEHCCRSIRRSGRGLATPVKRPSCLRKVALEGLLTAVDMRGPCRGSQALFGSVQILQKGMLWHLCAGPGRKQSRGRRSSVQLLRTMSDRSQRHMPRMPSGAKALWRCATAASLVRH